MLKHPHHPLNGEYLTLNCFQPEDWCTKYFHPMGENAAREPHYTKSDATTQFCRNSQVLAGRWHTVHNYRPPTRIDNFNRPFGEDCHGHNEIYVDVARCSDRHYLCGYSVGLYESCKFGVYPHGSWLSNACSGESHGLRLDAVYPSRLHLTSGSIGILTSAPTCNAFHLNWYV